MKNTCRRLFGLLMVLVMVSVSADFPVISGQTTAAIADAESATVPDAGSIGDNSADAEREPEKQPASVRYAYLSELLSQYFAGTKDGSGNDDPSAVLEERWTGLTKEEQNLFVLLKDGTWEFVRSNTGEIIGAREKTFEVDLASGDGNAEIPGAAVTEPEKDIPVINIEDPVIDVTPDVPDADNVPEIPDTADLEDLPDHFTDELPDPAGDLIPDDLTEQDSFDDVADTADIDDVIDPDTADVQDSVPDSEIPEEPAQDITDGEDVPDTDIQNEDGLDADTPDTDASSEEPIIQDETDPEDDSADVPDTADEQDEETVPADTDDSDDAEAQDEEEAPAITDADENVTDNTETDEENNQEETDSADNDTAEQEEKEDDKAEEPDADTDDTDEFRAMPIVGAVRRGAESEEEEEPETETINYAEINHASGVYNGEDQRNRCTSWTIKTAEGSILVQGTDYTVSVTDSDSQDADKVINAGTYTTTWKLTNSGKEKFTIGEDVAESAAYTIEKRTITSAEFDCESVVFDGENHIDEIQAGWSFKYGDNSNLKLEEGTDYVVKINGELTDKLIDAGKYTVTWELIGDAAKNYDDSDASLRKSATYSIKIKIAKAEYNTKKIRYDRQNHYDDIVNSWVFKNDSDEQINIVRDEDYHVAVIQSGFELGQHISKRGKYTVEWYLINDGLEKYELAEGVLKQAECEIRDIVISSVEFNVDNVIYDNKDHFNDLIDGWIFCDESNDTIALIQGENEDYTVTVKHNGYEVVSVKDTGTYTVSWKLTSKGKNKYQQASNLKKEAEFKIEKAKISSAEFSVNDIVYDEKDHKQDLINGWKIQAGQEKEINLAEGEDYTVTVTKEGESVDLPTVTEPGKYNVSWQLTNNGAAKYELTDGIIINFVFNIQKATIVTAKLNVEEIYYDGKDHIQELIDGWLFFDSNEKAISLTGEEDYQVTISKDGTTVDSVKDLGGYIITWGLTEKGSEKYDLGSTIVSSFPINVKKATIKSASVATVEIHYNGQNRWDELRRQLVLKNENGTSINICEEDFKVWIKNEEKMDTDVAIDAGTYYVAWGLTAQGLTKYNVNDDVKDKIAIEIISLHIASAEYNQKTIVYDGKDHKQELIDGWIIKDDKGREIKLSKENYIVTVMENDIEQEVEEAKNAGTYFVQWSLDNDENANYTINSHLTNKTSCLIDQALVVGVEMDQQIVVMDMKQKQYTGEIKFITTDQSRFVAEKEKDYTLSYSYLPTGWSMPTTAIPKGKGEYNVDVKLTGKGNFKKHDFYTTDGGKNKLKIISRGITADLDGKDERYYSGDNWTQTVLNDLLVYYIDPDNQKVYLTQDDYDVKIIVGGNDIKNAGDYKLEVTGTKEPCEGSVAYTTFHIRPVGIQSVTLSFNKVGYDGKDWYKLIAIPEENEQIDELNSTRNQLIIKTVEVEHPDGNKAPLILNAKQAHLSGLNSKMIDVNTYQVIWRLDDKTNYTGQDPNNNNTVTFKIVPASIIDAKFECAPIIYNQDNWFDQITVGEEPTTDKPIALKITAKTDLPGIDGQECESPKTIYLTSEDVEIEEQDLTNAGEHEVTWRIADGKEDNFIISDELLKNVKLTIEPASITEATIYNPDDKPQNTVVYNGENWKNKLFPNKEGNNKEGYFFVVKAKANETNTIDLTEDDFSLIFNPEEIINVGEYTVSIDPNSNFKIGEKFDNKLIFKVTPYPALPLKDETESVREPSKEHPVTFKGVYHMGPKQDNGARTLTISGEPGQTVVLEIDGKKAEFDFGGAAYDNYPNTSEEPEKLQITFNANGVLLDQEKKETGLKLLENEETTIVLSYKNTNLKKIEDDDPPASLDIKVLYDTIKPDLSEAIDDYKNRAQDVNFKVPEPGRLDSIRFGDYPEPYGKVFNDVSKNYGSYVENLPVGWNSGEVKLIQSGDKAMEVHYTDLACNEATENFAIGRSSGAPIEVTVKPITGDDRIDMSSKPEKISISITGTRYEEVDVFIQPNNSSAKWERLITGSGNWAQYSCEEIPLEVNTNIFPDNAEITVTARYKDLATNEEGHYSFYFDETADAMVMTMPQVTEDNWVISGIAEPGSTVEVYVNGERVSNRVFDSYTIFTARQPQMEVGDTVRIVATDLSGNRSEATTTIEAGPSNGKQVMGAYAMGKVYTDAHTNKENPGWMMAGLYTEEELLAGVKVPLVAANAFHIGEVSLQLKDGKPEYSFIPADGVELSGQHIDILPAENKTFSYTKYQKELAEGTGTEGQKIGYWVVASAEAEIPVELLHNSFQLDEEQEDIRALYFNRQRLNTLPTDEQP